MRLAVFASGSGSNFGAILDAVDRGRLAADPVLLLTDKPTAGALDRAQAHGIPTAVLAPADYDLPAAYETALLETLDAHDATFIALAGYLKKVPAAIVAAYRHRMLNVHPSLLPAFGGHGMYGHHVHQAVLSYGAHWTGATVHLVDEAYDTGPIVLQEPVRVEPDDTVSTLAARVLAVEHRLYPEALALFADGRVHADGRRVRIASSTHRPRPPH